MKTILVGHKDGTLVLWNANTGAQLSSIPHDSRITNCCFSSNSLKAIEAHRSRRWKVDSSKLGTYCVHIQCSDERKNQVSCLASILNRSGRSEVTLMKFSVARYRKTQVL